ncbi:hypothetical protein EB796_007384 [Bugula neritina]|uniref:C-type lectin domain-containing protein n=1 Tax=Bugula neritina TaxID=10212 RepID=A0A7J7K7T7_BUGNE|nr:hypothetical protein EB796_007384 [Bugula neritina]
MNRKTVALICVVWAAYVAGASSTACNDALSSCPRGYLYNPHSMSCFKISTQEKNWDDAKAACQSVGDRLAVFDSLETISWAKHMRKTHQDWIPYIDNYLWIGGRDFHGRWQWEGNIRKDIVVADWREDQPDNHKGAPQDCIGLFGKSGELQWNDVTCSSALINIIFIKLCDIFKLLPSDGLQGFLAESVRGEITSSLFGLS